MPTPPPKPHPLDRVEDFPFAVEVWDQTEDNRIEVLARCGHATIARAAFESACKVRPKDVILLRAKAMVVERRRPG